MQTKKSKNLAQKVPLLLLFLLGGSYIFIILNVTNWLMFSSPISWAYSLIPIIILFPGWLVPLGKCEDFKEILIWLVIVVVVSIFINFMAHFGLGAGDLGPGPV